MARRPSAILTAREYEVMDAVWKLGEANVHSIREEMGKSKAGEYTSVATMLRYLERKQLLSHHQEGKTFYYKPLKTRLEVRKEALQYVLDTFFSNDEQLLLKHLADLA
jgi:predicted transcriptional regulator